MHSQSAQIVSYYFSRNNRRPRRYAINNECVYGMVLYMLQLHASQRKLGEVTTNHNQSFHHFGLDKNCAHLDIAMRFPLMTWDVEDHWHVLRALDPSLEWQLSTQTLMTIEPRPS